MIRFIDLSDDYWVDNEEEKRRYPFAFLSTVTGKLIELCGTQTWDCVEDFQDDFRNDKFAIDMPIERFLGLIPDDVPRKTPPLAGG